MRAFLISGLLSVSLSVLSASVVRAEPKVSAQPKRPAEPVTLSAAQWTRPHTGEALAREPGLAQLVEALEREPGGSIVIAHNAGEDGQLWAEELRSWLVALGIASSRIRLDSHPELQGALILSLRADNP